MFVTLNIRIWITSISTLVYIICNVYNDCYCQYLCNSTLSCLCNHWTTFCFCKITCSLLSFGQYNFDYANCKSSCLSTCDHGYLYFISMLNPMVLVIAGFNRVIPILVIMFSSIITLLSTRHSKTRIRTKLIHTLKFIKVLSFELCDRIS